MLIHHRKLPARAALMPKEGVVCQRCGSTATVSGTEETVGRRAKDAPTVVISWLDIGMVAAYRFRIGQTAWDDFCAGIGVDGERLVAENYQGGMLEMSEAPLSLVVPNEDELRETLTRMGHEGPVSVVTANDLARSWKELYEKVCHD